jgi:hypothetical protein
MNATENSDRQWEQALATVLREQAPMADGASSLVGPSIHRAGRIRRRRQLAVTAAGVVAVAAVATPIAMGAFGHLRRKLADNPLHRRPPDRCRSEGHLDRGPGSDGG